MPKETHPRSLPEAEVQADATLLQENPQWPLGVFPCRLLADHSKHTLEWSELKLIEFNGHFIKLSTKW
ncbi:hypothetical protein DC3_02680 [Deinococcus cellulosilyticus NBRC 106333 = KACC 11606]|uniref:Uncharacterized protein n=1 Tax=Deinococcus cellulosilyticus (strain DSM 18568 / NBRC 106333 / KACC 11606 / 5516J-15) TaxID=1223518 RepID=A0A511MVM3_DEIC1|nr:hypothetical protein DC3_02680 [Deinococcus cellulosilyticus NBRC 106333 = KACC 11606]